MFKILFKILLGKLVALFGGFSKPELCAVYVAVYSNPVGVPYAQIKLRARNTLFCGFRIPVNCLFIILFYSVAGFVTETQTRLRFRVALHDGKPKVFDKAHFYKLL